MTRNSDQTAPRPIGLTLHRPALYDLQVGLFTHGRPTAFREELIRRACLAPGESVLDVGCGTGSVAIIGRRQVGSAGDVCGVDASPEMIAHARRKARKAGVDVRFEVASVEALPFPDARFDAALSTVMLHHLPPKVRRACVAEIRRVLKPGGRAFIADFEGAGKGVLGRIHRHGGVPLRELVALAEEAGLRILASGAVGVGGLQFVVAASDGERACDGSRRE